MDIKIEQEFTSVYQDPLFIIFLDLTKCYNNLDRGQLLKTLEGVQGRTKTTGITSECLGKSGGSHTPEWIPWIAIMSNQRDITGVTGLYYTVQCDN